MFDPSFVIQSTDYENVCQITISQPAGRVVYMYGEHGEMLVFPDLPPRSYRVSIPGYMQTDAEPDDVRGFGRKVSAWSDQDYDALMKGSEIVVEGSSQTYRFSLKGSHKAFSEFFDRCN